MAAEPSKELAESKFLDEFFAYKLEEETTPTVHIVPVEEQGFYLCPDEESDNLQAILDEFGFEPYSFLISY